MTLTAVKQPIKTPEQYLERLRLVHQLLKSEIRVGTKNYVKLGLSVVYINHYQRVNGQYFNNDLMQIWDKIFFLLRHPTKQKMLRRIGIEITTYYNKKYKMNRRKFRLLPAILPDRINFR